MAIDSFKPLDPREMDELRHADDAMKGVRKRTEELALPIIQKLTSGQINRKEAFKQLQQIFLKHFSSTRPIAEGLPQIRTSQGDEFLGNLGRLLLENGVSGKDVIFFLKIGSKPEDTRDKVEEVVKKD